MILSLRRHSGNPRGSVLLAVAGILFVILLFGAGLVRYMLRQSRLTHRQGQNRVTRSLAQGLANLGAHKLQFDILRDPNHALVKNLKLPKAGMSNQDFTAFQFTGSPNFQPVADALFAPLAKLGNITAKTEYACLRDDFAPLAGSPFPREKTGRITLRVTTTIARQGDSPLVEDFYFALPVKVTAALVPVLSKFTLFVEKAVGADSGYTGPDPEWRFNVTRTDVHGNLVTSPPAQPIMLKHTRGAAATPKILDDFVKAERGLVYLGGGKLYLNLSRGWTTPGKYSEGFHMFASGRGDGLYTFRFENGCALMNWDQGTAWDLSSAGSAEWYDFVRASPSAGYARTSSIFRLYGGETTPSPTLVLGEVFRAYLCARAFKDTAPSPRFNAAFLRYVTLAEWRDYISPTPADETESIATFAQTILGMDPANPDMNSYRLYRDLASNMVCTPFNLSLAFLATLNRVAFPLASLGGDPLQDYLTVDPLPTPDKLHAVPAPYDTMVPGANTLRDMQPFIRALQVPGSRTAWHLPVPADGNLLDVLREHGLAAGNKLLLDGWVYLDGDADIKFAQNLEIHGNGGIVLKKGTIRLQNELKSVPSGSGAPPILQIGVLEGNIEVSTTQPVQAALFAPKGSIIFGGAGRPNITGALAMRTFPITNASQGADVSYAPELAALPNQSSDQLSELPTLSISIDPDPVYLK